MTKKVFLLHLFLLLALHSQAQELTVKSMAVAQDDLTASVNQRFDRNGVPCALVKVMLVDSKPTFQGNVIGEVEKNGLSFLVYMSAGTKLLQVLPEQHFPLMISFADYGVKGLEAKVTYNLKIVASSEVPHSTPTDALNRKGLEAVKITIDESFFQEGTWELSKLGKEGMKSLAGIMNENSGQLNIALFGIAHGNEDPSPSGLAYRRAAKLAGTLIEQGVPLESMKQLKAVRSDGEGNTGKGIATVNIFLYASERMILEAEREETDVQ